MEHDRVTESPVRRGRGRVVMLVDNGVEGDSRVQKSAQSAAEAGCSGNTFEELDGRAISCSGFFSQQIHRFPNQVLWPGRYIAIDLFVR